MNEAFKLAVMKSMEDFGLQVRLHCDYDAEQFYRLKGLLAELAAALRHEARIDKDLALDLYALPQIVRNIFLSYQGPAASRPAQFDRLEDALGGHRCACPGLPATARRVNGTLHPLRQAVDL